jgi:hypothetical protein
MRTLSFKAQAFLFIMISLSVVGCGATYHYDAIDRSLLNDTLSETISQLNFPWVSMLGKKVSIVVVGAETSAMNDRVEFVVGEQLKKARVTVVPKEEAELSLVVYLALYDVDGKTSGFGYLYHSNRRIARLKMQASLIDTPTGKLIAERDGTARSIWQEGSILFVPTHYTETVSAHPAVTKTVSVQPTAPEPEEPSAQPAVSEPKKPTRLILKILHFLW